MLDGWIALLLLAQAGAEPESRIEPFGPEAEEDVTALRCTADRAWCARLEEEPGTNVRRLRVYPGGPYGTPLALYVSPGQDEDVSVALWPQIVVGADGTALLGLERRRATGFSGGGAQSLTLELVRIDGGAPAAVAELPLSATLEIRACFSERERRARRDACSDQYEFGGTLTLADVQAAGPPVLALTTEAQTYPGRRSRDEDNSRLRLRRSDLAWAPDPDCSYRRTFTWDAAAGRYVPDLPLPDCAQYFDF